MRAYNPSYCPQGTCPICDRVGELTVKCLICSESFCTVTCLTEHLKTLEPELIKKEFANYVRTEILGMVKSD